MASSKVLAVNNFIQSYLKGRDLNSITPVEIARELDKKGILKDSQSRPGLPLRRLIREGKIEGAWQDESKRWHIDSVDDHTEKYSIKQVAELAGYKSSQPIYGNVKSDSIPYQTDENGRVWFEKKVIENWIEENRNLPVWKPKVSMRDLQVLVNEIQKALNLLSKDIENVAKILDSIKLISNDESICHRIDAAQNILILNSVEFKETIAHAFKNEIMGES